MDKKNFWIGILTMTSVILLVGLVVIHTRPAPVIASGMTEIAGDYVLTIGQINASDEVLYLIDSAQQQLNVYSFDSGRGGIQRKQSINLAEMRQAAGSSSQGGGGGARQPTGRGRRP